MRITESRIRRIIREEAYRVLREQGTPAGAAISNLTGTNQAAADATAQAAAKLLEPNPLFKSLFPGGYAELLPAIKNALLSLGKLFVPRPFMFVLQDMLQSGAIDSIVSRERKAGKIPVEIMLSVAQAVAARSKSINESRRQVFREGEFDDFGGAESMGDPLEGEEEHEDDRLTPESVIERYKDEGPRSWMRVSNDFHEMADGGMDDILEKYYPGLTADDCAEIADTLDRHFGL
jgi:hypothetical protein